MKIRTKSFSIKTRCFSLALITPLLIFANDGRAEELFDLTELSLEDLMNVEVISVNRHAESLLDSAAAIYVINNQEIKQSGASSIPEILRMVPGIYAAQIDSSKWMVGSRSFSSRFSNNMQVMVDGRSIYTPAFNGVYWEQLDIVTDDIERIEVIRGPGSTLWGTNAVNGVINIITKSAADTQGGYAMLGAGNQQREATLRYGSQLNDTSYGRVYVKARKHDEQVLATGEDSYDAQHNQQGGFRIDSTLMQGDKLTLQGDIYQVSTQQIDTIPNTIAPPFYTDNPNTRKSNGWNLLGRWEKPLSLTSDVSLQVYLDYYAVDELALSPHDNTTLDIDFQHHKTINDKHDLIWGVGYNLTYTDIESTSAALAIDNSVKRYRLSGFFQDEMTLIKDTLSLTLGSKFEHNNVTGFEYQPSARLLFKASENQSLWSAVSRSVRTPSIGEDLIRLNLAVIPPFGYADAPLPLPISLVTAPDIGSYDAEEIISYELGYRNQINSSLSVDTTVYFTDYKNMRSASQAAQILQPSAMTPQYLEALLVLNNEQKAKGRGLEVSTKWQAMRDLRFVFDYSYTNHSIEIADGLEPDSTPKHSLAIRTMWDVRSDINFDMALRYMGKTTVSGFIGATIDDAVDVPAYWNMDMRLAWQVNKQLELSLIGKNLLHDQRLEAANPILNNQVVEISRSVFGMVEYNF